MRVFFAPMVLILVASAAPARAELMLFARYDWQDGAKDVSGSPIRHDGIIDPDASISGGKLLVDRWDGVVIGDVPELAGAQQSLLRFEDVTFANHGEPGAVCHSTILIGDGMSWGAGVFFDLPPYPGGTQLQFWLVDWAGSIGISHTVSDAVIDHFDSIEYRFDGTAALAERLAVRWNGGPWIAGAVGSEALTHIPTAINVRINNGASADEDPMWGSIGTVSLYSSQIPEPGAGCLICGLSCALALRRRSPTRPQCVSIL